VRSSRHIRRLSVWGALTLVTVVLAVGCSTPPPDETNYIQQIEAERAHKNLTFSDPEAEPKIPKDQQKDYLPLAYYPIDPLYHVAAALQPAESRITVEIPTSTGPKRTMERLGILQFTLNGQQLSLAALAEPGSKRLFVPFRDETSKSETYPAGRYLDLEPTPTGLYEIDFNRAYHPYCYFNATYECPFPPPENHLPIAIRAGEKLSEPKRAELNPAS